jgi:hypothetical protein
MKRPLNLQNTIVFMEKNQRTKSSTQHISNVKSELLARNLVDSEITLMQDPSVGFSVGVGISLIHNTHSHPHPQ